MAAICERAQRVLDETLQVKRSPITYSQLSAELVCHPNEAKRALAEYLSAREGASCVCVTRTNGPTGHTYSLVRVPNNLFPDKGHVYCVGLAGSQDIVAGCARPAVSRGASAVRFTAGVPVARAPPVRPPAVPAVAATAHVADTTPATHSDDAPRSNAPRVTEAHPGESRQGDARQKDAKDRSKIEAMFRRAPEKKADKPRSVPNETAQPSESPATVIPAGADAHPTAAAGGKKREHEETPPVTSTDGGEDASEGRQQSHRRVRRRVVSESPPSSPAKAPSQTQSQTPSRKRAGEAAPDEESPAKRTRATPSHDPDVAGAENTAPPTRAEPAVPSLEPAAKSAIRKPRTYVDKNGYMVTESATDPAPAETAPPAREPLKPASERKPPPAKDSGKMPQRKIGDFFKR